MGDLVERVAIAIKDELGKAMNAKPLLGDTSSGDWYAEDAGSINLEDVARAAIKAMQGDPAPVPGMTKTESLIYRFLEANPGTNSRNAIYDAVYANRDGRRIEVDPKIIHIMICKIRHKLPPNQVIETVHGFGYGLKYLEAQDASFGFTAGSRENHSHAAPGNEPTPPILAP